MPGKGRSAESLFPLHRVIVLIGLLCLAAGCSEKIRLSEGEIHSIGLRVFENECGAGEACLTSWNKGEEFASLGIGHFIWYPAVRLLAILSGKRHLPVSGLRRPAGRLCPREV